MEGLAFLRTPAKRKSRKSKQATISKVEVDTSDQAIHERALAKAAQRKIKVVEKLSESKLKTIQRRMAKQDSFKGVKEIIRSRGITKIVFPSSSMFFIPTSIGGQTFNKIRF